MNDFAIFWLALGWAAAVALVFIERSKRKAAERDVKYERQLSILLYWEVMSEADRKNAEMWFGPLGFEPKQARR